MFLLRPDSVIIIAGSAGSYGSGHRIRMGAFARFLLLNGIPSETFYHPSPEASLLLRIYNDGKIPIGIDDFVAHFAKGRICIVDARDFDPSILKGCHVIALDNRCGRRAELEGEGMLFVDTLPHPEADLKRVINNFLAPTDLIEYLERCERDPVRQRMAALRITGGFFKKNIRNPTPVAEMIIDRLSGADERTPGGLLVYHGGFGGDPELEGMLCRAMERGEYSFVASVGEGPAGRSPIRLSGVHPVAFYRLLFASDIVFTHFGMTMMEALMLKRPVVLTNTIPRSEDHRALAEYMKFAAGIPVTGDLLPSDIPEEWEQAPAFVPGGTGNQLLLELIRGAGGD